ncbi:hypothetical protein J6590_051518 [Homalodisca vitripennis]|nr:hypothetical protein J6590_051518 [Homalodisca vitripennis]
MNIRRTPYPPHHCFRMDYTSPKVSRKLSKRSPTLHSLISLLQYWFSIKKSHRTIPLTAIVLSILKCPTDILERRLTITGPDIALIQEPWVNKGNIRGLTTQEIERLLQYCGERGVALILGAAPTLTLEAAKFHKTLLTDHSNLLSPLVKANSSLTVSKKEALELFVGDILSRLTLNSK